MKNSTTTVKETGIAIVLLLVLFILLNPFHWWMANMMLITLCIIALVVFGLFALFIMQERTIDEREAQHKVIAGRAAFIAGTTILTIGILYQSISHSVDPWLYVTFVIMVLVKLVTRTYSDRN